MLNILQIKCFFKMDVHFFSLYVVRVWDGYFLYILLLSCPRAHKTQKHCIISRPQIYNLGYIQQSSCKLDMYLLILLNLPRFSLNFLPASNSTLSATPASQTSKQVSTHSVKGWIVAFYSHCSIGIVQGKESYQSPGTWATGKNRFKPHQSVALFPLPFPVKLQCERRHLILTFVPKYTNS